MTKFIDPDFSIDDTIQKIIDEIFSIANRDDFPLTVEKDLKGKLSIEFDPQWKAGRVGEYFTQQLSNDEIKNIEDYLKTQRSLRRRVLDIFNL